MNDCIQGIEFLCTNITQDQGIIVGREASPDRVAKSGLLNASQARSDFRLSVRYADSFDRRFVPSFENVDAVWFP